MKFREKLEKLFRLEPDILVISECEEIDRLKFPRKDDPMPTDHYWIGDNKSKGLAIFTFNNFKIDLYNNYSNEFKYILPVRVLRKNESYNLMGVWAKRVRGKKKGYNNYIKQIHLSLIEYEEFIKHENIIICGDFNSNLIWERTGIDGNHQVVLDQLEGKNIYSSYHHYFNEDQGKETIPTYYHYSKKYKPFHIDYCFLSENLLNNLKRVELGDFEEWNNLSDHVPMTIEF